MGKDAGTGGTPVTDTQDPEQIQREIEQSRAELGDTVEALAAKTDVKAQARRKAADTKASAEQLLGKAKEASPNSVGQAGAQAAQAVRAKPLPVAAAGAFTLGFVVGRITRR